MTLVPFQEQDFQILINWISTAELNYQWGGPNYSFPLTSEQIKVHCSRPDIHAYLFCVDNQKAGYVELREMNTGCVRFCRVFISNDFKGQGLAKVMLTLAMNKAVKELSCHTLSLSVFKDNVAALNLYKILGFKPIATEREDEFKFGKTWVAVEMEKRMQ